VGLGTTLQRHQSGSKDAHPNANDQDDNRLCETLLNARSETFDAGSRHKHADRKAEPECRDEKSEVHASILTPIPGGTLTYART
jgi:hypothetical protein